MRSDFMYKGHSIGDDLRNFVRNKWLTYLVGAIIFSGAFFISTCHKKTQRVQQINNSVEQKIYQELNKINNNHPLKSLDRTWMPYD